MTNYDEQENNNKYWYCNWRVNFRLKKKYIYFLLIILLITSPIWGWWFFGPDLTKGNDFRGSAIAFAIKAALGVETGYNKEFLAKLKKIDIPEEELDSLACVRRLEQNAREQCQYVDHKPTQTHYNGKHGRWPCLETDLMTLRECLRVEANRRVSDKEIEIFTNREVLDKYPHLLKTIEQILVKPCDYVPTEKDYADMKDEKDLSREFGFDRKVLKCDEKIDIKDREDVHLWLGGYGFKGKPASIKFTVRRRD